jgi:hypothetical protein
MLPAQRPDSFFDVHSGALTILILSAFVVGALLIVVPHLLRARQRTLEMQHQEVMAALEKGQPLPRPDERSIAAGRTASLVPMVVMCAAATVTCFLSAFKPGDVFAVSLAVWTVAGVVSLTAITGGVALMGRLAQVSNGSDEDPLPQEPEQPRPPEDNTH